MIQIFLLIYLKFVMQINILTYQVYVVNQHTTLIAPCTRSVNTFSDTYFMILRHKLS